MAKGKFSQPRNRFQEDIPSQVPHRQASAPKETSSISPAAGETGKFQRIAREEDAIDQAFIEVTGADVTENRSPDSFLLRNKKLLLVCVCSVLTVLLAAVIALVAFGSASDPYDGKILNNVTIAGIHVGGLTRSQAEDVLSSATDHTYTQQDMVVTLPDTTLRFSPAQTGAKLNVKEAVKAAYQYGRVGSEAQQQAAYENSLTSNHTIGLLPFLELDEEYILSTIQAYANSFGSTYSEASYTLIGEMPALEQELYDPAAPCQVLQITMGTPGMGIDTEELYEKILDAYSFNQFHVELKNVVPSSTPTSPDLEAIYRELYIAPVNATMNNQTFEAIPGSYGYGFDKIQAQRLVDAADFGETVDIPMEYIEPNVQDDELFFQDELGYCETPHSNNDNRTHNLRLVCEILNGLVLYPGEEFSYNGTVGERTAARGFRGAPAYSGTKLVNSIGGGVCQGSSTLYYCALLADMEITDRINHGFPVSYIPYGLDATVNWGGPDFKFRNTSNYPIRIEAEVSDGFMKMRIMGTEERDYYIKLEYEITRYITPEVKYEEYGPDSGYKDGEVLEGGTTGYIVRSYKCKYSIATDKLISRDYVALSSYMTEDKVVVKIIGGDPSEPSEPSESTEPSEPSESTDPPATDPPATDPPATDPPATDPPATDPPATDPPATDPPGSPDEG